MFTSWRTLFTWLLLLALPLQGLAATGWVACHDVAWAGAAAGDGAVAPLPIDHDHEAAPGTSASSPCHEPEGAGCSACAACCVVALTVGAVVPLRHPGTGALMPAAMPPPHASAWTPPLERPPRIARA